MADIILSTAQEIADYLGVRSWPRWTVREGLQALARIEEKAKQLYDLMVRVGSYGGVSADAFNAYEAMRINLYTAQMGVYRGLTTAPVSTALAAAGVGVSTIPQPQLLPMYVGTVVPTGETIPQVRLSEAAPTTVAGVRMRGLGFTGMLWAAAAIGLLGTGLVIAARYLLESPAVLNIIYNQQALDANLGAMKIRATHIQSCIGRFSNDATLRQQCVDRTVQAVPVAPPPRGQGAGAAGTGSGWWAFGAGVVVVVGGYFAIRYYQHRRAAGFVLTDALRRWRSSI